MEHRLSSTYIRILSTSCSCFKTEHRLLQDFVWSTSYKLLQATWLGMTRLNISAPWLEPDRWSWSCGSQPGLSHGKTGASLNFKQLGKHIGNTSSNRVGNPAFNLWTSMSWAKIWQDHVPWNNGFCLAFSNCCFALATASSSAAVAKFSRFTWDLGRVSSDKKHQSSAHNQRNCPIN